MSVDSVLESLSGTKGIEKAGGLPQEKVAKEIKGKEYVFSFESCRPSNTPTFLPTVLKSFEEDEYKAGSRVTFND